MKLGVNGWRLRTKTGVGRVLLNIIKHWTKDFVAGRFEKITLYSPIQVDPVLPIPDFVDVRVVGPDSRMLVWENLRFAPVADDEVLFCPSYSRPLLARGRTVTLMFEATQALFPQFYSTRARLIGTPLYRWSARHSTLVITSTDQSRKDIIKAYGVSPANVRVVSLAPAEVFRPLANDSRISEIRQRYVGSEHPFFLHVGKITPRRNVPRMIEALAELKRQRLPHRLVIVGLNAPNVDIGGLIDGLGLSETVRHYEYVSDEDLALLYSAAEAFVLPYSYEALSLTVLEAQAAGAPVITTDTPGLREMAGEAAMFMRDAEVKSIAEAMSTVANDPVLRRKLVEAGLANAGRYSWRCSSAEILDILKEAAAI